MEGVVAAAAMVRGLLGDPTNLAWVTSAVPSTVARAARLEMAVRYGPSDPAFSGELEELVARAAAGLERLGEDPAHLAWARCVIAERRNWGQTVAMLWTDLHRYRARFVREVAARTITAS